MVHGLWSIVYPAPLPGLEQMRYNGDLAESIARKPNNDALAAQTQLDGLERLSRAALSGDIGDGRGAPDAPDLVVRIVQGGPCRADGARVLCAHRDWCYPFYRSDTIGFRMVAVK
jgi:hypothetical protein